MTCYCFKPNQIRTKTAEERVLESGDKRRAIYSIVLLGFLGLAILGYLWQTNSFVGQGYTIAALQKQQMAIEAQTQEAEIILLETQSLKGLKEQAQNLGMVAVSEMSYLSLPNAVIVALLK